MSWGYRCCFKSNHAEGLFLAPQVAVRAVEHWVSVHCDKIVEKSALFIRNFDEVQTHSQYCILLIGT